MTHACQHCSSVNTTSVKTQIRAGGRRWRMIACKDCNQFCEYINNEPRDMTAPPNRPLYNFSDATLRRILLATCSHGEMASQVGCSYELVRQIRRGIRHKNRVPNIPRWVDNAPAPAPVLDGPSCLDCINRSFGDAPICGMGFPDPDTEGPEFAADCSLFAQEGC